MRNKKGFTLVELVIVIAVIAILAGVMIGTFASVVKKAKKSAEQQEMAAAKQEQVANDVIEKLNNGSWLGWTDFEEKLAKALADVNITADGGMTEASVKSAVAAALNEYAAAHPDTDKPNTGLTEQQVKYIIENALSGQLTAEQVKAIVNNAVSSTSTLTKSQVQAIVDAAVGKTITASQIKEVVNEVLIQNKVGTSTLTIEQIETLINSKNYSVLTEKEVENIIKEALKNYSVSSKNVTTIDEINAALADTTVTNVALKLTDNLGTDTAPVKIDFKKNAVIDLNGKTLVVEASGFVVETGVTVTITGNGKVESASGAAVVNKGNLVIESGDFVAKTTAPNQAGIVNDAKGFLTINGGSFKTTSSVYNIYAKDASTIVINGGTFEGCMGTNGQFSKYSNVVINGGTFTSDIVTLYMPSGTWSIYGGTFTGKATVAAICGGNVNIYGGKFASTTAITENATAKDNSIDGAEFKDVDQIFWDKGDSWRAANVVILVNTNRGTGYLGTAEHTNVFISSAAELVPFGSGEKIAVVSGTGASTVITSDKWAENGVTVK